MGLAMRLEQERLHPALYQGVDMVEPIPLNLVHYTFGELEMAHPCVLARWA
jgi:hypothetical protein